MRLFVFTLVISLMFLNVKSSYASNDYPAGCVIQYNGGTRVYTDYKFTDDDLCRHYSLSVDYVIGNLPQQVSISYTTPYKGTCIVDGATKGTNVIISELEEPGSADNNRSATVLNIILLSVVLGSFALRFYFLG